jgi:hypothetical protein
MDYVVKDLAKYGYVLKAYQKKGGRMVRVWMAILDSILVISILLFIALLVWSRVMGQTMLTTLYEVKEFISSIFVTEVAQKWKINMKRLTEIMSF